MFGANALLVMQLPTPQSVLALQLLPTTESGNLSTGGVGWQVPAAPVPPAVAIAWPNELKQR
jgi:hypothetical protein